MMSVNGVSNAGNQIPAGTGLNAREDSVSKNLKKQIQDAQKRLQEISSNEDLEMEEKMKKRQEILKEITTLNQQLRQRQIELQREQRTEQKAQSSMNKEVQPAGTKGGLSQSSMQSIISADSSFKQAKVQEGVAVRMEGQAGVLKAEINQDKGKNTQAKEAELAKTEQKISDIASSQADALREANQAAEETKEADQTEHKKQEPDDGVSGKKAAEETVGTNVDVRL